MAKTPDGLRKNVAEGAADLAEVGQLKVSLCAREARLVVLATEGSDDFVGLPGVQSFVSCKVS